MGLGVLVYFLQRLWRATTTTSTYVTNKAVRPVKRVNEYLRDEGNIEGSTEPREHGWRMVSLSEVKLGTDVNSVFPGNSRVSIVLTYDPRVPGAWLSASRGKDDKLKGSLVNIKPELGYWVFYGPLDSEQQLAFGHMGSEIELQMGQPLPGWSLESGWTLISRSGQEQTEVGINSVFTNDDRVKTVMIYNQLSRGRRLFDSVVRSFRSLNSVICGAQVVHDDLLRASRGKDGMFRGNLKTIRQELGYWVYRESSESN